LGVMSWTARPERDADIGAVRAVNLAAFPTAAEADLDDALRGSSPLISVVVSDTAGEVAAHALLSRCHVGGSPALALAPCAVLPRVQRRGAGSAAIRFGLAAGRDLREP